MEKLLQSQKLLQSTPFLLNTPYFLLNTPYGLYNSRKPNEITKGSYFMIKEVEKEEIYEEDGGIRNLVLKIEYNRGSGSEPVELDGVDLTKYKSQENYTLSYFPDEGRPFKIPTSVVVVSKEKPPNEEQPPNEGGGHRNRKSTKRVRRRRRNKTTRRRSTY